jgi:cystathionine beta-lyase
MLDNMELFAMGYSYGGFESLITPCKLQKERVSDLDQLQNTIIRLYIGLEDISDLINDLESGFSRLKRI